jgi:hypothetical protein
VAGIKFRREYHGLDASRIQETLSKASKTNMGLSLLSMPLIGLIILSFGTAGYVARWPT